MKRGGRLSLSHPCNPRYIGANSKWPIHNQIRLQPFRSLKSLSGDCIVQVPMSHAFKLFYRNTKGHKKGGNSQISFFGVRIPILGFSAR